MKQETAIVFIATFLGVIAAVLTFNLLIENKILPAKAPVIAKLEVEPQVASAEEPAQAVSSAAAVDGEGLEDIINNALNGSTGKYGIAIKNLRTGESYYKDENTPFESASLYKLWVMGTSYEQIKEGKLHEDDVLSANIPALNKQFNIASESAERNEGGVTLSVKSALQQMITISHNYAALLLSSKVKLANVKAYLESKQLTASKIGSPPKTTAADTLKFFEKLYRGELADKESTAKMIDLLKKQRLNKKLPRHLPSGTVIAHKTGELGRVSHDAGIVYTDKGEYIIVVLTESSAPLGAEERIADISKNVFDYFTN